MWNLSKRGRQLQGLARRPRQPPRPAPVVRPARRPQPKPSGQVQKRRHLLRFAKSAKPLQYLAELPVHGPRRCRPLRPDLRHIGLYPIFPRRRPRRRWRVLGYLLRHQPRVAVVRPVPPLMVKRNA